MSKKSKGKIPQPNVPFEITEPEPMSSTSAFTTSNPPAPKPNIPLVPVDPSTLAASRNPSLLPNPTTPIASSGSVTMPFLKMTNPPVTSTTSTSPVVTTTSISSAASKAPDDRTARLTALAASKKAPSGVDKTEFLTSITGKIDPEKAEAFYQAYSDLMAINGQDSYSAEAVSLGKVTKQEHLILPRGFVPPITDPADVGAPYQVGTISLKKLAQIYALNKAACNSTDEATRAKFALIRLEAVKMGWVDIATQSQIAYTDAPADALQTFANDLHNYGTHLSLAQKVAFLVPFMAEFMFRTTGHHYLSNMAADYNAKYKKLCEASLVPDAHLFIDAGLEYHSALHWITPGRVYAALKELMDTHRHRLPDAIVIRANAAPAGTAIITTTSAVLNAMDSTNLYRDILQASGMNLNLINTVTSGIRADPVKFHKSYFAYGLPALNDDTKRTIEAAASIASKFAPISQAFINVMFRNSALEKARALTKHAEQNPLQLRAAERYFRAISRRDPTSLADLFATDVNAE